MFSPQTTARIGIVRFSLKRRTLDGSGRHHSQSLSALHLPFRGGGRYNSDRARDGEAVLAGTSRLAAKAICALIPVAVLAIVPAAPAELNQTTEYRDNRIAGTTARAVWQYMIAHPIIDPDDGPAYANITHDHKLAFRTSNAGGVCRVNDLTFRWKFVITLPKPVDYGGMDGATQKMWKQFASYLKGHEDQHRSIFLECGKVFVPAAEKLTGPAGCSGMDRKVTAFVAAAYDRCMTRQREFDHRQDQTTADLALIRAAEGAGKKAPGP
jgi:predicted secreted Zn-dependent protease